MSEPILTADGRSTSFQPLGRFTESRGGAGIGIFDLNGAKQTVDVVRNYPWTLSKKIGRDDIPEIILQEHRNEESAIKRNLFRTWSGVLDTLVEGVGQAVGGTNGGATSGGTNMLNVYEDIFPDNPTGYTYYMPYFSKTFLDLTSSQWEQLDDIGASIDNLLQGTGNMLKGPLNLLEPGMGDSAQKITGALAQGRQALEGGYETVLKTQYPVVGVFDRPRIFTSHTEREIKIEFPLYNTISENDWKKNRDLVYRLMTQFLYIKTSYITGFPPVFYRVLIPGEYFSFASCVTNFNISNAGNIRKLYGFNVPDAYQFSITLKEMCMPSLNQFQSMTTGEAATKMGLGAFASGVAPGARGAI
jgi:hypothetical protein